jgi:fluoride ion exporter CrcB/FEX
VVVARIISGFSGGLATGSSFGEHPTIIEIIKIIETKRVIIFIPTPFLKICIFIFYQLYIFLINCDNFSKN